MGSDHRLLPASNYLRHLLNNETAYRGLWLAKARRSGGSPNVAAVSAVLAEYHWQHEFLLDDEPPTSDRSYKDRVARALSAKSFTPATARLFGHAFGMKQGHVDRLVDLVTISSHVLDDWPTAGTTKDGERPYRTVSLHELHTIGSDRLPVEHRTIHAIQANRDGVDTHIYAFDTPNVSVQAVQGVRTGPVEPVPDRDDFWMVRLRFTRPLQAGDFRFFEYVTNFDYRTIPPPEFRRGLASPLQTLSMRVAFSPACVPKNVVHATWATFNGDHTDVQALALDDELAVYVVIEDVPAGKIHGIRWEWD